MHISPAVFAILALLVLFCPTELLGALLLAALCHELGHYVVLRLLGAPIERLSITPFGAEMQTGGRISYGGDLLSIFAGPFSNGLLAFLLALGGQRWPMLFLFAGTQAVLGAFNLLPILPLDGGRILWTVIAWGKEPYTADRAALTVSRILSALLILCALALLRRGGSPALLFMALWLWLQAGKDTK